MQLTILLKGARGVKALKVSVEESKGKCTIPPTWEKVGEGAPRTGSGGGSQHTGCVARRPVVPAEQNDSENRKWPPATMLGETTTSRERSGASQMKDGPLGL